MTLTGQLSGGTYSYTNRDVVISNAILLADTTVSVAGGSISVSNVTCALLVQGNPASLNGPNGQDGTCDQAALSPTAGGPGFNGWDLTLSTSSSQCYSAGSITIGGSIDLSGGNGGNGGGGGCNGPGAPGGNGGHGGILHVVTPANIVVSAAPYGLTIDVNGGEGGRGGSGGHGGEFPGDYGEDGGGGGLGGSGGLIIFEQTNPHAGSISMWGASLLADGEDGGNGGGGGSGTAQSGVGGDGGWGGLGGQIEVSARQVNLGAGFSVNGADGGHGGDGGGSEGDFEGPEQNPTAYYCGVSARAGNGGEGGNAGTVEIAVSGAGNSSSAGFSLSGGSGGHGGNASTHGSIEIGWGGGGGSGGLAGALIFSAPNDTTCAFTASVSANGGSGGNGGAGGEWHFPNQGWPDCEDIPCVPQDGKAGDGGNGGFCTSGGSAQITAAAFTTLAFSASTMDGGNGGDGGMAGLGECVECGNFGVGKPGCGGGQLTVNSTTVSGCPGANNIQACPGLDGADGYDPCDP